MFLISCFFYLILKGTDVLAMSAVLPDTIDPSSVVEMSGWGVSFPPNFPTASIIPLARRLRQRLLGQVPSQRVRLSTGRLRFKHSCLHRLQGGRRGNVCQVKSLFVPEKFARNVWPYIDPQNISFHANFVLWDIRSTCKFDRTPKWYRRDHNTLNISCESHLTCQNSSNKTTSSNFPSKTHQTSL